MDWILSAWVLFNLWIVGNKRVWVWYSEMACALGWIYYAINIKQYGLIPSATCIFILSIRNLLKWRREDGRQNGRTKMLSERGV